MDYPGAPDGTGLTGSNFSMGQVADGPEPESSMVVVGRPAFRSSMGPGEFDRRRPKRQGEPEDTGDDQDHRAREPGLLAADHVGDVQQPDSGESGEDRAEHEREGITGMSLKHRRLRSLRSSVGGVSKTEAGPGQS